MAWISLPNSVCGNTTPYRMARSPLLGARLALRRACVVQPLIGQRGRGPAGVERLDADMVGAGCPVLVDAPADRRRVAPGDHRVDQSIGAAAGEVRRREAEAEQVVAIVRHLEVAAEPRAADAPRPDRIGLGEHGLLWAQELARAQDAARLPRVRRRDQV